MDTYSFTGKTISCSRPSLHGLHLMFGESPVIVQVHLLEGLVRSWSISDFNQFYFESQRSLWRNFT